MNYIASAFKLLCCLSILSSCRTAKSVSGQKITLTNMASVNLTDKAIVIKRNQVSSIPADKPYPILRNSSGELTPSQLDDLDGDGKWDELFLVANLPAHGQLVLSLSWDDAQPDFPKRTSVRFGKRTSKNTPVQPKISDTLYANQLPKKIGYQPYQTDGPSWENDKVGFRHYFDGRNSKDLFGKRLPAISPENVGLTEQGAVEDNYHVLKDWGRDILAVGNSVGLGGLALQIGERFGRLGVTVDDSVNNVEATTFQIALEGPVRSVMKFGYTNWKAAERLYKVNETVSIWPGMYAYQNEAKVSGLKGDETLLIGLVNSNTKNPLIEIPVDDQWVVLLTHDKQTYNKEFWLGLALILPKEAYLGYGEAPKTGNFSTTFYGKLKISNDKPVRYFAVGGWELSDKGFTDATYFRNYVTDLTRQLAAEVKVEVK